MDKANFEITNYKDLTTLVELAHLGHFVLNGFKRENEKCHSAHEEMYTKIAELYKSETLKNHPEKSEELDDIEDYLIGRCGEITTQFEHEHIAEFLANALIPYCVDLDVGRKAVLGCFAKKSEINQKTVEI